MIVMLDTLHELAH